MTSWHSPLTLRQLEIFSAVVREGSLTRAAEVLFLSEPAVSHQLKLLERTIGVVLLERAPHKPQRLTPGGERLFAVTENVVDQLQRTLEELAALRRGLDGVLAIGLGSTFSRYLFPPLYASFREQHPGITIQVVTRMIFDEALLNNRVDVAIVSNPVRNSLLSCKPFAQQDFVIVARPEHGLSGLTGVPLGTLQDEDILIASHESHLRSIFEQILMENLIEPRIDVGYGSVDAIINSVLTGLGVGLVPFCSIKTLLASDKIAVLDIEGFPIKANWYAIWPAKQDFGPAARFRQFLIEQRDVVQATCLYTNPAQKSR